MKNLLLIVVVAFLLGACSELEETAQEEAPTTEAAVEAEPVEEESVVPVSEFLESESPTECVTVNAGRFDKLESSSCEEIVEVTREIYDTAVGVPADDLQYWILTSTVCGGAQRDDVVTFEPSSVEIPPLKDALIGVHCPGNPDNLIENPDS